MGEVAIRAESLSKQYIIAVGMPRYDILSDRLADSFKRFLRRTSRMAPPVLHSETIWPLKDVSFEVNRGEVIGIIGRNGAGKSTLLKILSRITEPTSGRALLYGRVGSLLEVGTGFHPELTGRDNIYLSGAILGMKRAEIKRKFDEIVDFAEVEKFLDTPIKHYSSGMHVRLGFAVAAHMDPEILIVDEVLAVGDWRFQKKCIDKMQDVGKQGQTIILVSHDMSTISRLCRRVILLDLGRVVRDGTTHDVIGKYLYSEHMQPVREWPDARTAPGGEVARLLAVRVRTEDGQIPETIDIGQPVGIEMEYEVLKPGHVLLPNYDFHNEEGVLAFGAVDLDPAWRGRPRPAGRWVSTAWIPGHFLSEGRLFLSCGIGTMDPILTEFYERNVLAFQVIDRLDSNSARGDYVGQFSGVVRPLLKWGTEFRPG